MIKIKYNGIKIKTDNIDEAVAILESLKGTQLTYRPDYLLTEEDLVRWTVPDSGRWTAPNPDHDHWKVTCSGITTVDAPTICGDSLTVTSN